MKRSSRVREAVADSVAPAGETSSRTSTLRWIGHTRSVKCVSLFLLLCTGSAEHVLANGSSVPLLIPGGRAGALAGAFAAVSDDAQAIFYNPAGMALISDPEAGVMYVSRGPGFLSRRHFISADVFFPTDKYGIGGGLLYENRTEGNGNGSSYTLCGTLATGSKIGGRIAVGVGAKYLRNVEQESEASAVGGDLGIMINFSPVFLGFSSQNWEGVLDHGAWQEELAGVMRFSVAYVEPSSGAPIAVEYRRVDAEEGSTLGAGVEIPAIQRKLYLRTGYIRETGSGGGSFLLGFGLRLMEQADASTNHPIGYELNVYDNLSAGGLRDLRIELRRRRL